MNVSVIGSPKTIGLRWGVLVPKMLDLFRQAEVDY